MCFYHNQILYTFSGNAVDLTYNAQKYGSNMISYHDISDYMKPFLLNGYSLWNKLLQDLNPSGGYARAVSVGELIYIIGTHSHTLKPDQTCCIQWVYDFQVFDPNFKTIKGQSDGIAPLDDGAQSTSCHFRSTTYLTLMEIF